MKKQKMIITLLTMITLLLILMPNVEAALQSNGGVSTTQIRNNWIVNIRKMEALNGGMGLTEIIGSDLVPTTASNNVDVHMEKNTEYGAMAILSASSYGNPNVIASGDTTTGNKTGIVINLNKEWVAATSSKNDNPYDDPNFLNANGKYKNIYPGYSQVAKKGDATLETAGWHNTGTIVSAVWLDNTRAAFIRAYSGSIFSYYGRAGSSYTDSADKDEAWASRAAMVCGEGI